MAEIIIIILLSILILLVISCLIVYLIYSKKMHQGENSIDLSPLEKKLQDGFSEIRHDSTNLRTDINREMVESKNTIEKNLQNEYAMQKANIQQHLMDVSAEIQKQLTEYTKNVGDTNAKLQNTVNTELDQFRDKINNRLVGEFKGLTEIVENKLSEINQGVETRLKQSFETTNKTFIDIREQMVKIDEAQKNIATLSMEMVSLQNILTNNQQRGQFGEQQLNQILYAYFGENNRLYSTQYTIEGSKRSDKVRADAVLFLPEPLKLLCIDSKFPYSSYQKLFDDEQTLSENKILTDFKKEVKKHIDDISSKYIIDGVTANFAWMFVPSDGILTLLHNKCIDTIEYANKKGVVIVSPTLLTPLLASYHSVYISYQQNKNVKVVINELYKLSGEFAKFSDDWNKFSKNINQVKTVSESLDKRVNNITNRFEKIKDVQTVEQIEDVA